MSRIGKKPIPLPNGVQVNLEGDSISIKGPKGLLSRKIHPAVSIDIKDDFLQVSISDESKESRSLYGLFRVLLDNMVTGVTKGFERNLEIIGVGYRTEVNGKIVSLNVGYSHAVNFLLPEGVSAVFDRGKLTLSGIDKELLGATAAQIRQIRKPNPYKGKGIKYQEEIIRRKAGKAGSK